MNRKKVFVLLTRFPDLGSKIIHLITRCHYTHASIGLEEDMNTFYSFVRKGFIVEKLTRYLKPDREPFPCLLYEIEVSDEVYGRIQSILSDFVRREQALRYTKLGVMLGLSHVSFKRRDRYFCSQFVAEVLKYGRAVYLQKDSSLYFPGDFGKLQGIKEDFRGDLQGMVCRYRLASV